MPLSRGLPARHVLIVAGATFGDGAASVGTGVYNAGRFVARGIGAMGPDEQARWVLEGAVMDAVIDAYATNPEIRDQMNAKGFETLRQIIRDNQDGYLKWYFVGRVATGAVVNPLGVGAALGDFTRAVENKHDAVDAMIRGGVFGRPENQR